jgi:glycosyltransferase involved in cell wall biosynthesis
VDDRAQPSRTLFLSHTTAAGGAEMALLRMLAARPRWNAVVLLARPRAAGLGVFESISSRTPVVVDGVSQPFGASNAGPFAQVSNALRLVAQALSTRIHPAFRTADIVVANTTRSAAYGALAALTSCTPFVVHVRDLADSAAIGGLGAAIMRHIVLPRADGIIADTRSALASATPFLRPDAQATAIVSASGIVRRDARPRDGGPLVVGMLARIDPWKGQELLVDAFAQAFPEGDERLELAGGAPFGHEDFAARLRRRAEELGISDRVALLGHVDDVDAVLDRWDVAVQASLRPEPLGQNVIQYLAAGCTAVVADEGGPTEWVQDGVNGRRFCPRDADALAAVLRELGADPVGRRTLAETGARTPGLRTDSEVADEHAAFYDSVIVSTRRAGWPRRSRS